MRYVKHPVRSRSSQPYTSVEKISLASLLVMQLPGSVRYPIPVARLDIADPLFNLIILTVVSRLIEIPSPAWGFSCRKSRERSVQCPLRFRFHSFNGNRESIARKPVNAMTKRGKSFFGFCRPRHRQPHWIDIRAIYILSFILTFWSHEC